MNGYQRATRPRQAAVLADIERKTVSTKLQSQLHTHKERPEGGSLCPQGRGSYRLTEDDKLVTCKSCRKLMEVKS